MLLLGIPSPSCVGSDNETWRDVVGKKGPRDLKPSGVLLLDSVKACPRVHLAPGHLRPKFDHRPRQRVRVGHVCASSVEAVDRCCGHKLVGACHGGNTRTR